MKKILLSGLFILAFILYASYQHLHPSATTDNLINSSPITPANNSIDLPPSDSGLKDGTYTGNAVDAFYGIVQVRATISAGRLTNVEFLQYPNDRGHSSEVSAMSIPRLRSEAIAAQRADVDIVSGATQTSEAFIQSLQSALAQA